MFKKRQTIKEKLSPIALGISYSILLSACANLPSLNHDDNNAEPQNTESRVKTEIANNSSSVESAAVVVVEENIDDTEEIAAAQTESTLTSSPVDVSQAINEPSNTIEPKDTPAKIKTVINTTKEEPRERTNIPTNKIKEIQETEPEKPVTMAATKKPLPKKEIPTETLVDESPVESNTPATRGKRFGIWALDRNDQGNCILTTPTFQVRDGDFSSQFWIDIEKEKLILNSSLTLNAKKPKTGIKFDNEQMISFDTQELPSRVTINQSVTAKLANSQKLNVFLNGEEIGNRILQKTIQLKETAKAVNALNVCK